MTSRRAAITVTCAAVTALGILLAVTQSGWIATIVSALAAVAAVGVAIWAAVPATRPTPVPEARIRVSGTGQARSGPGGTANTGLTGPASGLRGAVEVERTGPADASDGGNANTGIHLT